MWAAYESAWDCLESVLCRPRRHCSQRYGAQRWLRSRVGQAKSRRHWALQGWEPACSFLASRNPPFAHRVPNSQGPWGRQARSARLLFSQQILVGPLSPAVCQALCVRKAKVREGDSVLPLTALRFGWGRPPSKTHRNRCHGDERAGEMGVGVAALAMGLRHRAAETLEKGVFRSPRAPAAPVLLWAARGRSGAFIPLGQSSQTG